MKKIYSYVLMAAMLLIGADAWAAVVPTDGSQGSRADLQAAIDNVNPGTSATLELDKDFVLDGPVWLGTESLTEDAKSITLDLNGKDVIMTVSGSTPGYMFVLTHGELKIVNNSNNESQIRLQAQDVNNYTSESSQIFSVYGSYKSSRWNEAGTETTGAAINTRTEGYFSHLEIGKGVTIVTGNGVPGCAIAVDQLSSGTTSPARIAAKKANYTIEYWTDLYASRGYAHGARVDVYGTIFMTGKTGTHEVTETINGVKTKVQRGWKCYGIKTNGNLGCPITEDDILSKKTVNGSTIIYAEFDPYLENYNTYKEEHKNDTVDVAFVYVHDGSSIETTNSSDRSTAIYASGYAKWLIEGRCEGNIGVSVSSGSITLNNADVSSTSSTYTPPTGASGVTGSGSGLVVNSRDAYPGSIDVTISGTTEVSSTSGYGVEETVNTSDDNTKVSSITITGGTISAGDEGTVLITESSSESETTTISITGANIEVVEGNDQSVQIGKDNLTTFLTTKQGEETHATTIKNGDGTETIVISQGPAPTGEASVIAAAEDASVNWKHLDESTDDMAETLTADMKLAELEMSQNYAQTLTVPTGKTLNVGRVVLGKNAKIIVEPGATFIVSGTQGISSSSDDCVVIENSETSQGTFLINPDVTSNTQPRATVNMIVTEAGKVGEDYYWHRFASPVKALTSAWTKSPNYGTYLYGWDYTANDWAALSGGSTDMVPWKGYTLSFNEAPTEITYTFKGQLLGNVDAALNFQAEGYNFFGNSYSGYIDAKTLVEGLVGKNIRGTIYVWNAEEQGFASVTWNFLVNHPERLDEFQKEIASMQTFILQLAGANTAEETIDYSSAVWGNPRYGMVTSAPARRALAQVGESEANMKIIVTAENGKSEFVTFERINSMSDAYDDGYDANKYMNSNHFNMYATVDGENYTSVVTDNLIGKKLTINTLSDVNYTMTFKFVEGEGYAIRDNMTNEVIAITNGNSYSFSAQPNTKIDGRFEIVNLEKVYTGVEDVDTNKDVRGIYTLLGQYVGEDFNALPAGVYIINGVKVVK